MNFKRFAYLGIICVFLLGLAGCVEEPKTLPTNLFWPTYPEFRTYDNFKMYKSDFERIVSVVEMNGAGNYNISTKSEQLSKKQGNKYVYIEVTEDEKMSMCNIVKNTYCGSMSGIFFSDDPSNWYVHFYVTETGCGVVYTEDIEAFLEPHKIEYYYNILDENWYSIYY